MGRLIDIDVLLDYFGNDAIDETTRSNIEYFVSEKGTVEAIQKDEYENRLRADMVAMLTELKNELIDVSWNMDMYDSNLDFECCYLNDIDKIIQQKINSLETESEAEDGNVD